MRQYPHCDARVLHAPGECSVCDEYASDLQEIRKMWGINFTNHHETTDRNGIVMLPCPAEVARPLNKVNAWYGNTAKTNEHWTAMDQEMKELRQKFHVEGEDDDSE